MRVGNIDGQALLLRKGIPFENWNDFSWFKYSWKYFHKNRSIYSHVGCMFDCYACPILIEVKIV